MLADYALTFLPWISYLALLQVAGSWRFGFLAGLAVAAGVVAWRTVRHEGRLFDLGTLLYCLAMTLVSSLEPDAGLKAYNVPLSLAAVGGLSTVSLLVGAPFTYRIERVHVAPAILADENQRHRFYTCHVKATASWAVACGGSAALAAMLVGTDHSSAAVAVQAIGILVAVGATRHWHERFLGSATPAV